MEIMRGRKSGWVHARIFSGKMVILFAQKFRVEAGVVEVLVHRDEAEAEGVWVAALVAARGDDESGMIPATVFRCGYLNWRVFIKRLR